MKKGRDISRREFLRGAGAVCLGAAAVSLLGGCGAAAADGAAAPAAPAAPAAAAEKRRTVLAFASDTHAETAGFEAWLKDQLAVFGDGLRHLSFGGDICDKAWVPDVFGGFRRVLDELTPGRYAVTTGNQENKPGAPGAAGWDAQGPGFVRMGEALRTDDCIVYHFGAAQEAMSFPDQDIDALSAYLDGAPNNIPIFIVSHFPLHLSVPYSAHAIPGGARETMGSEKVVEVLNRHPNTVFLWGHNHTFMDPRYGTIRPAGSKFTVTQADVTRKAEIGFTYANLGSFCRGDTYGLIAETERDGGTVTVKLYYVDTNVPMETKERAVLTFGPDGSVNADVTLSETTNYVDMFYLAGWYDDPAFAEDY